MNIEVPDPLYEYLRDKKWIKPSETIEIQILKGGVSNRTVLVKRPDGPDWVIKQAMPKLRVEEDWYCSPSRIQAEAKGIEWLSAVLPEGTIPKLIFQDHDQNLLIMEAVPSPHINLKATLLDGNLVEDHFSQMGKILGMIHKQGNDDKEAQKIFGETSFFEILRLEPYYVFSAARVGDANDFLLDLCDQTTLHRYSVVHGDFSPKNLLSFEGKLRLIDHEVIHFGDATFDLGFSLCHLLSKGLHMRKYRSELHRAIEIYIKNYLEQEPPWNDEMEQRAISHTLGCLIARVHGRSPLEYLSKQDRKIQCETALEFIRDIPCGLMGFIEIYFSKIGTT